MDIAIAPIEPGARQVQVSFTHPALTKPYSRPVNACFDADGAYDEEATKARVDEVALGIDVKIATGAIQDVSDLPEPVATEPAPTA